ncbi:MAG: hypothetical protein ACK530_19780 [Alphaproteobacteria bacterium]
MLIGQGETAVDAVRAIGMTKLTYYCWRTEFGGPSLDCVYSPEV